MQLQKIPFGSASYFYTLGFKNVQGIQIANPVDSSLRFTNHALKVENEAPRFAYKLDDKV